MPPTLVAGAATADITPDGPQFLFGYPHVARISTGVHDRLLSSSLYLCDGRTALLLVSNDVVAIGNETARRVRQRIQRETGVPAANILITASHTHSGPLTIDLICCEADAVVPKADPVYIRHLEDGIVAAAVQACGSPRPAEVGLAIADGSCVGGNRHDPAGPSDPETPVLVVRDRERQTFLAAMIVCSMHPTDLHEDSTLISGDFPAMTRRYLQEHVFGKDCPVLHHTGPSGNQSPRHIAKSNTFDEATRLGSLLGRSIAEAVDLLCFTGEITLGSAGRLVELPARSFPTVDQAQGRLNQAAQRLETLRRSGVNGREVRTAECDWFGAEETLTLARAAVKGRLRQVIASVMPAEITLLRIGPWAFVGWPGEAFVEFALRVKSLYQNCYVISLANGELQGYVATEEAMRQGWYEAMNSVFSNPEAGMAIVEKTLELLNSPL
jgi:neutral ceramidase